MSDIADRLRKHVASYNSITLHRQDCLDAAAEIERLSDQDKNWQEHFRAQERDKRELRDEANRLADEIEQLQKIKEAASDVFHWHVMVEGGLVPGDANCWVQLGNALFPGETTKGCEHTWCDIATGGQYCRLCDARRESGKEVVSHGGSGFDSPSTPPRGLNDESLPQSEQDSTCPHGNKVGRNYRCTICEPL